MALTILFNLFEFPALILRLYPRNHIQRLSKYVEGKLEQ